MTELLELKEKLQILYGKYSFYANAILKFLLAVFVFTNINRNLDYLKVLNNFFVILILALLCSILPMYMIVISGGIIITLHTFALGIEVGGVTLLLFALMYLLYFRFSSKDALAIVMTPAAFSLGMPCMIPLGCGLLRGPGSAISICIGTITYYYIRTVREIAEPLKKLEEQDILGNVQALIGGVFHNKAMYVFIIAGAAVAVIVYAIRRMSADFAWYLAIGTGCLCYIIIAMCAAILLKAEVSIPVVFIGTIGSGLCALILEFFAYHADYRRSEFLEYQDDTYYYYVKAVPKKSVMKRRSGSKNSNLLIPDMAGKDPDSQSEDFERSDELELSEKSAYPEETDAQPGFSDIDFEEKLEKILEDIEKAP